MVLPFMLCGNTLHRAGIVLDRESFRSLYECLVIAHPIDETFTNSKATGASRVTNRVPNKVRGRSGGECEAAPRCSHSIHADC